MFNKEIWNLSQWVKSRAYLAKQQHDLILGPFELRLHRAPWKYMRREEASQGWQEYIRSNDDYRQCWY